MARLILNCAIVSLASAVPAAAVVIDFESVALDSAVTTQYPTATFSTITGQENRVQNGPFAHMICTAAVGGDVNCTQPTFIDFASPVNNLTFLAIEPNEYGVVASINIFENYAYSATYNLIGLGASAGLFGSGNETVDLTAYSNVTRIEILGPGGVGDLDNSYGGNGIGWDNFSFEVVPAPGSAVLFALAALGSRRCRSRAER